MAKGAGQQKQILVFENSAAANRSRARVELIVDEVHDAGMSPFGLVGKADHDGIFDVPRRWPLPLRGEARVAEIIGLRCIEDEMDRVKGHDRRQQRRARLTAFDEIAGIDPVVRDAAGNGRAHLRPFEIELGVAQGRFGASCCAFATSRLAFR